MQYDSKPALGVLKKMFGSNNQPIPVNFQLIVIINLYLRNFCSADTDLQFQQTTHLSL
jgi:hypothetical protein